MERKITNELLKWKRDSINKPFFLYGARQVGKTYSVLEFGEKYYRNIVYFNAYNNLDLEDILKKEKSLDRAIMKLEILSGEKIYKDETLIVFDNCYDVNIIKGLKIFGSENDYHVVIISADRLMVNKAHFEEFYYKQMTTMDFEEYLRNSDKVQLIDFIKESYDTDKPMPFHQMALDIYFDYLMCGGFPEVVNAKLNGDSELKIESLKQKIIAMYRSECITDENSPMRGIEIIDSMPWQLLKGNKKFQYGLIKKGARSKDYDPCINTLVANLILNRSFRLTDIKSPLSSVRDTESFKLYFNDVGLLYNMLHLNKSKLLTNDDIRRSLVENDVANTLINYGYNLYYYQSDGKSEVNFIVQNRIGKIIPIEVIDMKLVKAKALTVFLTKYGLNDAIRVTEDNFAKKKGIKCVPLYATFCLKDL